MKKAKSIFLILVLSVFLIPSTVLGVSKAPQVDTKQSPGLDVLKGGLDFTKDDEDVIDINITEGEKTVYFMQYPNNIEYGTENKEEANNPEEILIYEGTTDEHGEIVLEGWKSEGQLRIVEDVPNGYSTSKREIVTELSSNSTASFVNYKGFINPNTGRSIIMILIIAILVCLVAINLIKKQKELEPEKKKRKVAKVAKILILAIGITSVWMVASQLKVNANAKDFIITVNDIHGAKMKNVNVKVYAKPSKVEQASAIKFSSGEGTFLDGSKEMYFRLPSEDCSFGEFYDSLTVEQRKYLNYNFDYAYSPNNRRTHVIDDLIFNNPRLSNGTTVTQLYTMPNENEITIDGNGGYMNLYGKRTTEITVPYYDINRETIFNYAFENPGSYYIGLDSNKECTHYDKYGTRQTSIPESSKYYVCWGNNPDGIYVNDVLFKGNEDSCYSDYFRLRWADDAVQFRSIKQGTIRSLFAKDANTVNTMKFTNISDRETNLTTSFLFSKDVALIPIELPPIAPIGDRVKAANAQVNSMKVQYMIQASPQTDMAAAVAAEPFKPVEEEKIYGSPIRTIKIVKGGEVILSITSDDITCNGTGLHNIENESFCTITKEKRTALSNYLTSLKKNCNVEVVKDDFISKERDSDSIRKQ